MCPFTLESSCDQLGVNWGFTTWTPTPTTPRTASVTKYTVFHVVRVRVFLNCDKSKLGMFQAASKVSSVVGHLDVVLVLAQACQSPGGQVSICQLKWFLAFHLFRLWSVRDQPIVVNYLPNISANPFFVFHRRVGGSVVVWSANDKSKLGCVFFRSNVVTLLMHKQYARLHVFVVIGEE